MTTLSSKAASPRANSQAFCIFFLSQEAAINRFLGRRGHVIVQRSLWLYFFRNSAPRVYSPAIVGLCVARLFLAALSISFWLTRNGCVSSQSALAVLVGSISVFCHQTASSPARWTSRWCPRQSGTVNSSLTLRPSARLWTKRTWWASAGWRPQIDKDAERQI